MYLKTTKFNKDINYFLEEYVSPSVNRYKDIGHSHLILYDDGKQNYQRFDISMPYLLLYEAIHKGADISTYIEFNEHTIVQSGMAYSILQDNKVKMHSHNFYELTFVLSGRLTMKIEGEERIYYPGECCLCNKNIHHVEIMDDETEIFLFLAKEEYLRDVFWNNFYYDKNGNSHVVNSVFHSLFDMNRKNQIYDTKVYIDFKARSSMINDSFLEIINAMIGEISSNHSGKSHMMKALICRFAEMLWDKKCYNSMLHWAVLTNDEKIVFQISKAYENKKGIFTRAEIEKITGYNSDYVERILKGSTGYTLVEYGRIFLTKKAAKMLRDTDLSVSSICEELGYSNRNYFNQIFKKQYKMLPSEYRRQYR